MTVTKIRADVSAVKQLLASDKEFLKPLIQAAVQEMLEAEMAETLGAEKGERTEARLGYRSGHYTRSLITWQDRAEGAAGPAGAVLDRAVRALSAVGEGAGCGVGRDVLQGVSTRKVKQVTEELVGHAFSASAISAINKRLDASLKAFCERKLREPFPYLILDARYERIREDGIIASHAVLIAIGVDWEGRRQVLAVELANRESRSSWKEFLEGLKTRGLHGVEFVVSDDHPGLKKAIPEVLTGVFWQRCYVHFLRNALDYVPRKVDDDCLLELRWMYDRRDLAEVRRDLAAWLAKWGGKYPKLTGWVEENIDETLTYFRLPLAHRKHMKSTNMLERLNEEIRRRTMWCESSPMPRAACGWSAP